MRTRDSARLLIINSLNQVLLFRFRHENDALVGKAYWATPGGGVKSGETFEQAAIRELSEETGIYVDDVGRPLTERTFEMALPSGEVVLANERFYLIKVADEEISTSGWTENEKTVIDDYHWWNLVELRNTEDVVYPSNIPDICSMPDQLAIK
ncbi:MULTISPECIES: NUDIX domain-containing protein [unclassified Enterobacter]|uniref:NUDIX hydrolase n=1 Tax=unclassified Enterobacter TaxID=2608935 RepID=UPI0015CDC502|nr:8-oxo-dGTP pyrophosphatase MutT (NUDIX family) [Enterobacter sp. Sphag1F]NYI16689.1 8-oxo-dGTP pyrophosphatase MutT (NUDIX family) [Enterobacter sp. Sphag71]